MTPTPPEEPRSAALGWVSRIAAALPSLSAEELDELADAVEALTDAIGLQQDWPAESPREGDAAPAHLAPTTPWPSAELRHLAGARELQIAAPYRDGSPGPWTPIWVVVVAGEVFVRTWHRRDTGWYGRAAESGRASILVSNDPVDVIVTEAGGTDAATIDAAYLDKYGVGAQSMVTAEASASTLRLARASLDPGR